MLLSLPLAPVSCQGFFLLPWARYKKKATGSSVARVPAQRVDKKLKVKLVFTCYDAGTGAEVTLRRRIGWP